MTEKIARRASGEPQNLPVEAIKKVVQKRGGGATMKDFKDTFAERRPPQAMCSTIISCTAFQLCVRACNAFPSRLPRAL